MTESKHREAQRLEPFLACGPWDYEQVNARRLELLTADPVAAPHSVGVLVLDDTGDRKAGHATAHVDTQYLGSVGKIDHGIVAVTTIWADDRTPLVAEAGPLDVLAAHRPRPFVALLDELVPGRPVVVTRVDVTVLHGQLPARARRAPAVLTTPTTGSSALSMPPANRIPATGSTDLADGQPIRIRSPTRSQTDPGSG
ncbi:MAG: hypothetical protein HOV87_03725 [Catenulispora sp.]|nr:hypothetical protein [Catenulispora sp.]